MSRGRFADLARLAAQRQEEENVSNRNSLNSNGYTDRKTSDLHRRTTNGSAHVPQIQLSVFDREPPFNNNTENNQKPKYDQDLVDVKEKPANGIISNGTPKVGFKLNVLKATSTVGGTSVTSSPRKLNFKDLVNVATTEEKKTASIRDKLSEKVRKIIRERMTVKQIFKQYVETSTLHGFRYACMDTFKVRRFLWATCMILGAIYFIIKLQEGITTYFTYPYSTLSTLEYEQNLTFPAISFCPINGFKKSVIMNDSKLLRLYQENRLPLSSRINKTEPSFDIPGDELAALLEKASLSKSEVNTHCIWQFAIERNQNVPRNNCSHKDLHSYMSDTGQTCYTLNSGKPGRLELRTKDEGKDWGYELMFHMNRSQLLPLVELTGMEVFIHDQKVPPLMAERFFISTGYYTYIALTKREHISLPSPYDTACGTKQLKYFKEYDQQACLLERLTDTIGEECGCRPPYLPDNKLPYCSLQNMTMCAIPVKEKFSSYENRKFCPNPCKWTTYSKDMSYSSYLHAPNIGININKSNSIPRTLMEMRKNLTEAQLDEHIEQNIVLVNIYYGEMAKEKIEQESSLDFYQLLGDMGGEIGLMLGASLLTFVEFLDLFVFLGYHQLLRVYKSHKRELHEKDEEMMNLAPLEADTEECTPD